MVDQRKSTSTPSVEQLSLLASQRRESASVDVPYLLSLTSLRRVIRYSMSLRDLEPKQVFDQLDMDKATWSRIENGGMSFPADLLERFRQVVGNDAAILWLANQAGFDVAAMRKLQDDKDKEIVRLREELATERSERATIARFVRENLR